MGLVLRICTEPLGRKVADQKYHTASSDGLTSNRESAALIIAQPESPVSELLSEDSVLLAEIFNDGILLAAQPSGERGHEDLPGLEDGGHPSIVAR